MKNFLFAIALTASTAVMAKDVTIYSVYPAEELGAIFKPFTERTGINVNFVSGTTKELVAKLKEEGANTKADLYLDKDLTFLDDAKKQDLFRKFESNTVKSVVPAHLRDGNDFWTLVFYRARVIMYNKQKVSPAELSTYEDLGSDKWLNRLCVRTSTNSYNQALGGYLVKHLGEEKALTVLKSWVKNFSVEPINNDRGVIQAVADGKCHVGLANSYYLPNFIRNNPDFPVTVYFPNQNSFGTHVNGVGIGITKYAKNVKEANLLLEYFTSTEVQGPVAQAFSQYPVNKKAEITQILQSFGTYKEDETNISNVADEVKTANRLFQEAQYK